MSAPQTCPRPCWIQTVIVLAGLLALAWWSMQDPMLVDADDCTARGRDEECWRER